MGIEAQRAAVMRHVGNAQLLAEFVEVESGKKDSRSELEHALRIARLTGAVLVIARLDRLSRNAAFLFNLQKSGVRFVCADLPEANEITIAVLAILAEHERRVMSERVRAALAVAKMRGSKIGNPRLHEHRNSDTRAATRKRMEAREQFAKDIQPIIADIVRSGITGQRAIARELNNRGFVTPWRRSWSAKQVKRYWPMGDDFALSASLPVSLGLLQQGPDGEDDARHNQCKGERNQDGQR